MKKNLPSSIEVKRRMMEPDSELLTISRQCELLEFPRSSYYFHPRGESEENLKLMLAIDKYHMENTAFGSRQIAQEFEIGRERAKRLMRIMGIEAVYPKPRTTHPDQRHEIYPYLLRDLEITGPNHVWSTDITYIPMAPQFAWLSTSGGDLLRVSLERSEAANGR